VTLVGSDLLGLDVVGFEVDTVAHVDREAGAPHPVGVGSGHVLQVLVTLVLVMNFEDRLLVRSPKVLGHESRDHVFGDHLSIEMWIHLVGVGPAALLVQSRTELEPPLDFLRHLAFSFLLRATCRRRGSWSPPTRGGG